MVKVKNVMMMMMMMKVVVAFDFDRDCSSIGFHLRRLFPSLDSI